MTNNPFESSPSARYRQQAMTWWLRPAAERRSRLAGRHGPFDGFVLDIVMTRMSGNVLAQALRCSNPDAKIDRDCPTPHTVAIGNIVPANSAEKIFPLTM
jgi:hypothetical protein